ncbi:RluA family pseudouridine synthase [Chloroflexota bacterium]
MPVPDKHYSLLSDENGVRLDKYISEKYPELSRSQAQKLIADGYITVDKAHVKASFKISTGNNVDITIPSSTTPLSPEAIPLKIVYEDDDLLVIDKPAGLTVHPAPGHPNHTLVNALLAHSPEIEIIDGSERPGIVHRLDKDTSGLILVAKKETARRKLISQFETHEVTKGYLALVKGNLTPDRGIIEAPIGRDPANRKRMAVVTEGKKARTHYTVKKHFKDYTLLEIRTETGRTHQIRVHLSAIGFPIAGDETYGGKTIFLPRQFLHAHHLGFNLPTTEKYVEFNAELPPDLAQSLETIN